MSRPRKKQYSGLPPNLHFDMQQKAYRYYHPLTKKRHYIGKDRAKAVSAALQLNSILMQGTDLVSKVIGTAQTLSNYLSNRFEKEILEERNLAEATIYDYSRKLIHIKTILGDLQIDVISVKDIADFLLQFPPTQANRYRALLSLIFKHAVAEGLCHHNPAESTMNRKIVKQRQRLTLEGYKRIYQIAEPWLKNAMDLGLLTLQRREDLTKLKFSDIKDGHLYIIQKKTFKHGQSAYIKIKIGNQLSEVLKRCKDKINSEFIIHRLPDRFISKDATYVTPDYLSKAFSNAREQTEFFSHLPVSQRPSFHEIRSLGIKLYEDSGIDAQALAGHKSRTMTEQYKQGHEQEWTEAEACLDLLKI